MISPWISRMYGVYSSGTLKGPMTNDSRIPKRAALIVHQTLDMDRSFPVTARTIATRKKNARGMTRRRVSLDRRNLNVMARSASPGVVARIVHYSSGGKQETVKEPHPRHREEVQALEHNNIEFLKDGE